ncbi:hypothetical protein ACLB2K_066379 [Fragaria x ananassa]
MEFTNQLCKCIQVALSLLMLGAWSSEATSRSLQDVSMFARYEQWMARYGRYENASVPATMDWRQKGAVTPVKDQGQCGCCWAFSAVAAMEGITQLTTGKLISLSEQELVDCDVNGEDQGCEGGLMDDAFRFINQNHGLSTEANYPYAGVDGTCNVQKEASHAASITGHEDVPANTESALLKAVANQPISVAIDVSGSDFQFYQVVYSQEPAEQA